MSSIIRKEIGEPLSWIIAILAVAFALGKWTSIIHPSYYTSPTFIGVLVGMIVHELAHKLISIRYGLKAEFMIYTPGLLLTLVTGFIPGIAIIAPGYVKTLLYGYTPYVRRAVLYSVVGGPASNIAIAILALVAGLPLHPGTLKLYFEGVAVVNAWIAFFNLLPVPPLDGYKIFRMTPKLWTALIALSIALYILA